MLRRCAAAAQEVSLSFTDNEAFLFAGFKLCTVRLPPGARRQLTYNLMPISAGHVPLPPLHVVARAPNGGAGVELVSNAEARLVFVTPPVNSSAAAAASMAAAATSPTASRSAAAAAAEAFPAGAGGGAALPVPSSASSSQPQPSLLD